MTASPPTEFVSTDGYYQPEGAGLFFSLSPMMVGVLLLLLALAALIGWWMGQRRAPSDDPCEAIYDDIRKAINTAAGASRDSVMIAGRKLQSTLDDRLGAVLKLADGLNGPRHGLDEALEGMGPDHPPHDPEKSIKPAKPEGGLSTLVIKARDVVFHTHEPHRVPAHDDDHAEAHDAHDGDHSSGHGAGDGAHGAGHGHTRPLDAPTQIAKVRAAVHALSDHWNDKAVRLAELRAARRQLTHGGGGPGSGRV